jgi:fumarate reductase flavoprotein subunit
MMGGVVFGPDCATPMHRLFAAGEDTGGVHGANRLGGNGVANSTVFGGLAGHAMAPFTRGHGRHADPDPAALEAGLERVETPFGKGAGDLEAIRERLFDVMWDEVGILRTADGLARGLEALDELDGALEAAGVADRSRAFNLTWHDWLNLKNLVLVSKAIAAAALARTDSRGAHFREDFPTASDLARSRYTVARLGEAGRVEVATEPVHFTRVAPGETLLRDAAE